MILAAIETRITIRNPQIVLEKGIPDGASYEGDVITFEDQEIKVIR